uniref:Carboxypeptidase Q n=1 Tax=Cyprinus carpio TaxID=7962 RepID=A0A8C2KPN1_CYPCA
QKFLLLTLLILCSLLQCDSRPHSYDSKLLSEISKEVFKYSDINRSYERLAELTDTIGNGVSGSKDLDLAIKYMYNALTRDGLENVHLELVKIPHWVRGEENAVMLLPRNHTLTILGLGSSVETPPGGIEAEVMVVESFEELKKRASDTKGKIVVYNQPFVRASKAAKVGAVASLIRSVTPFAINSPHTSWQWYQPGVAQIPTACITVEDAQMMARMTRRGQRIVVHLTMRAQTLPDVDSQSTPLSLLIGLLHPCTVVLLSGHLDSWDVSQGAMDDGGGVTISWEGLSLIRDLGLRPIRTLRTVLWSAEERGGMGAANISNYDLVMESDLGTFSPLGLQFTGSLLEHSLNPVQFFSVHFLFISYFFPSTSLHTADQRYFWFYHSDGDTMSVQNPEEMNLCSAVWAVVAYVVVDLDEMFPR